MKSVSANVDDYLKKLPADRREILERVREQILQNLDEGFEEGMQYGMIGYYVPHRLFPDGYHCDPKQPLPFAGLASQKNHMAVYLMWIYSDSPEEKWFRREWGKTGKKLDMGKCCVRFRKLDDVALDVIGRAVQRVSAQSYIDKYVRLRSKQAGKNGQEKKVVSRKKATRKVAAKKAGLKKGSRKTVSPRGTIKKVVKKKSAKQ